MVRLAIFFVVSLGFVYLSRKSLQIGWKSHGFHRFFAWEFILAIFLLNAPYWYENPFSGFQIVSWLLLAISIFFVASGVYLLKVFGNPTRTRNEYDLYAFEKTSSLVTVGIYRYIRHPLYSSLFFLTWGIYFKDPSVTGFAVAIAASFFLHLTGKYDEAECLTYFGSDYQQYMQGTKRFVPFLF